MKYLLTISLLASAFAYVGGYVPQLPYKHKSEAEISRMTPVEKVDEYCLDEAIHGGHLSTDSYTDLLVKNIYQDGLKSLPRIGQIIDEYRPSKVGGRGDKDFLRYQTANFLLGGIDSNVIRIRGYKEGKEAINAVKRSVERMKAMEKSASSNSAYEMQRRIGLSETYIKLLEGLSLSDRCIKDTFKLTYGIELSEKELLDFVNYLVSFDPTYPAWSQKGKSTINIRNCVYQTPERFFTAYNEFKKHK